MSTIRLSNIKDTEKLNELNNHIQNNTIHAWNVETGKKITLTTANIYQSNSIYFSPNKKIKACCIEDFKIQLIDVPTNTVITTLAGHNAAINSLFFLDNNTIASTSNDYTIRLWKLKHWEDTQSHAKNKSDHIKQTIGKYTKYTLVATMIAYGTSQLLSAYFNHSAPA